MKKFLLTLILMCAVFLVLPEQTQAAQELYGGYCGDSLRWSLDDEGVLTITGSGSMYGYSTSGSVPWYKYKDRIVSVELSEGVTSVGKFAFYECSSLKWIDLQNVKTVGDYAFAHCSSLPSVFLSTYTTTESIGSYAFYQCTALKEVSFISDCEVGEYAFAYCDSLDSVYISDTHGNGYISSFTVADNAFVGVNAGVYYPAGVTPFAAVVNGSYGGSLTWKQVTNGTCGSSVRWSFDSATGTLILSGTGAPAKYYDGTRTPWGSIRKNILRINIEDGITYLPSYLFEYAENVEQVTLPNTLVSMACNAFNDCTKLNNLLIPASLTAMDYNKTFNRCSSLTDIYYMGTAAEWNNIENAASNVNSVYNVNDITVHCLVFLEKVSTCTEDGILAHYCFEEPTVYTQKYDSEMNLLTKSVVIPAPGHLYENGVCTNCSKVQYMYALYKNGELSVGGEDFEDLMSKYDSTVHSIKLFANTKAELTLNDVLFLDLNGYDLTGIIDTNGYSVYIMDSTTDGYTCDSIGYFNCLDSEGNPVVPVSNFKTDRTGSVKRYMTIADENGYSFHRFYLGVTHASIKPGAGGVGYKAVFAGDEMVRAVIDSYGYSLRLEGFEPVNAEKSGSPVSGKAFTLRLNNFDVENYSEAGLTAQVYITVNGEKISASAYTTTVKDMIQAVDVTAFQYTAAQFGALKAWLSEFNVPKTWNLTNI